MRAQYGWTVVGAILLSQIVASSAATAGGFTCPAATGSAANDEKQARQMFDVAVGLEPSDPQGALIRFSCAQSLADKPAIALRIGEVSERLGKTEQAIAAFERYLALAGSDAPDAEKMRFHISELRQRLGSGPAPSAPSPRESATPSAPSSPTPVLPWVLVAGGGVGVTAGVIFLAIAKSKNDSVHDLAPGSTAWDSSEAKGTYDAGRRAQTVGLAALAIGGALTATGVVLLLGDRSPVQASVAPQAQGASVALFGRF